MGEGKMTIDDFILHFCIICEETFKKEVELDHHIKKNHKVDKLHNVVKTEDNVEDYDTPKKSKRKEKDLDEETISSTSKKKQKREQSTNYPGLFTHESGTAEWSC